MYQRILLAVDLNEVEAEARAIETAGTLAETFKATLDVLTVIPDYGMPIVGGYFPENFHEKVVEEVEQRLEAFVAERFSKDIKVQEHVGHGAAYHSILDHAQKSGTDLIIMASHRPELKDYLLGPNASRVVRHAGCSVMVVRG